MAQYIQVTAVKKKLHELGKRVPPAYLYYLDAKVAELIESHARITGRHKTIQVEDLEVAKKINSTLPPAGRNGRNRPKPKPVEHCASTSECEWPEGCICPCSWCVPATVSKI